MNHFWKELSRCFQTKLQFNFSNHPQTDNQTEVVNHNLGNMLCCVAGDRPKQWDVGLPQVEFAFNSITDHSIGKAPFEILYTKSPNHIVDLLIFP